MISLKWSNLKRKGTFVIKEEKYWKRTQSIKNRQLAQIFREGIKPEHFASACQFEKVKEEISDEGRRIEE